MGRQLNVHVHIDGQVYGPGVDVPDEVAARITNPDVWDDDDAAADPPPTEAPARRRGRVAVEPAAPAPGTG